MNFINARKVVFKDMVELSPRLGTSNITSQNKTKHIPVHISCATCAYNYVMSVCGSPSSGESLQDANLRGQQQWQHAGATVFQVIQLHDTAVNVQILCVTKKSTGMV